MLSLLAKLAEFVSQCAMRSANFHEQAPAAP